ncbi:MAG: hypothetical protein U0441_06495 [Polyangiaceae bacterium]
MVRTSLVVALLGALGLFAAARGARADVAGPRDVCEFDEKTCASCWEPYGKPPEGDPAFKTCQESATAKGYKESCRNRQGAGDNVVFCAEGASAQKVTKGGGCGGCSLGEGAAENALLGAGAVAAMLAARRRKSPQRK